MRPASFYVGLVILGTVAPLALAAWATIVTDVQRTASESVVVLGPTYEAWDTFLVWIAGVGFLVALIEARIIAVSLLGARLVGRPITVRQALARARAGVLAGRRGDGDRRRRLLSSSRPGSARSSRSQCDVDGEHRDRRDPRS